MSSYDEQLNQIRAARKTRDQARADLHEQLLEQLRLLRAQRRVDSKETVTDAATLTKIATLRQRIADDADKLREIDAELAAIERLQSELETAQALMNSLAAELELVKDVLAQLDGELNGPNITPERRAELEAERAALAAKVEALNKRIAELKDQIEQLSGKVDDAAGQKAELEHERARLETEIKGLQGEIDHLAEGGHGFEDRTGELNQGRERITDQRKNLSVHEQVVGGLIGQFFGELTPQTLIEQWNDATPIMLLPLRLETRFKDTDKGEQLWVRVYPDEVAVTTHEKILTDR